jgi:hypothetical protein
MANGFQTHFKRMKRRRSALSTDQTDRTISRLPLDKLASRSSQDDPPLSARFGLFFSRWRRSLVVALALKPQASSPIGEGVASRRHANQARWFPGGRFDWKRRR